MKVSTRLAGGAALVLLAAACHKEPKFQLKDETALLQSFDSSAKAIRLGMWDSWASAFAENAVFQPANGKVVTGHESLVAWGRAMPMLEELTFVNQKVWGDGDLAYGTSDYVLKTKDAPADTGKQLVVFKRSEDGKWWIAAVSFNSDMPVPKVIAPKPAVTRTQVAARSTSKAAPKRSARVVSHTTSKPSVKAPVRRTSSSSTRPKTSAKTKRTN